MLIDTILASIVVPINFDQHYIDIFQFLIYTVKAVP